jgi:hypothetical protein
LLNALVSIRSPIKTKTKPLVNKNPSTYKKVQESPIVKKAPNMQGWFNIQKSDNIIHQSNKTEDISSL